MHKTTMRKRSQHQAAMRTILAPFAVLVFMAGCNASRAPDANTEIAALRAQVEALEARQVELAKNTAPKAELGQQMLLLQLRHGRLWAAGQGQDWLLAQFQLAELNEALDEVVEQNGDAAALQPQQLSVVLPAIMKPAIAQMRTAIDDHNLGEFEKAYDGLSNACSACHQAADHGFLVIQRPKTPVLDNLRSESNGSSR